MNEATFTSEMPNYKYMKLPDSDKADVFIYRFKEERIDEDGNKSYVYDFNEFRTSKLTEAEIANDPFSFLEYTEKEKTDKERIADLEKEVEMLKQARNS